MISIPIVEASQVAQARRAATELARNLGFTETEEGKVALLATEVATNLTKHATGGQLLVDSFSEAGVNTIEILALDKGPGMENVSRCIQDGYSTTGSPGTGLGAILRLSSLSDIYSVPGVGTALLARIQSSVQSSRRQPQNQENMNAAPRTQRAECRALECGVVCLPKPGEEVCGDAWAVDQRPNRCLTLVADGLGHGPSAAVAAREAVHLFRKHVVQTPAAIMTAAHAALRATRGAALAISEIDQTKQQVRFCGVGNIAGHVLTATGNRGLASHNGVVGHEIRKIQEFTYPWTDEALLVLHSDGLASRWSLDAYPGLVGRHVSVIAGVLYRDFSRGRDDVTVMVVREAPGSRD